MKNSTIFSDTLLFAIFIMLFLIYRTLLVFIKFISNPDPLGFDVSYHLFTKNNNESESVDDNYATDIAKIGLGFNKINFVCDDNFA